MRSPSTEDYLKTLHKLEEQEGAPVSVDALAQVMDVSSASASNMVKRLDELDFLTYEAYEGATLTEPGRTVALEVLRHHRLLELYLRSCFNSCLGAASGSDGLQIAPGLGR